MKGEKKGSYFPSLISKNSDLEQDKKYTTLQTLNGVFTPTENRNERQKEIKHNSQMLRKYQSHTGNKLACEHNEGLN